jgi:hypothetical protein
VTEDLDESLDPIKGPAPLRRRDPRKNALDPLHPGALEWPSLCAISPAEKAFGEQLNDLTLTSPGVDLGTHLHHG